VVKQRLATFLAWAARPGSRRTMIAALVAWNVFLHVVCSIVPFPGRLQGRHDASGFSHDKAHRFHYFHYYLGHFPLATLREELNYSEEGARRELQEHGADLVMEHQHWSRLGESARIYAYLPHAWLTGSAKAPSIRLFNLLWFLAGSLVLYIGFSRAGLQVEGTVLVLLVNLTPFFWHEVHSRENIFGLMASLFMLVLGLNAGAITGARPGLRGIAGVVLSALAIAFCVEVRNELVSVVLALVLLLALAPRPWWYRAATVLLTVLLFQGGRGLLRAHFDAQWRETTALVRAHGGHVYTGPRIPGHKFWHPMFCGLGDFGTDHGYAWDDRVAYAFAVPILNERLGMRISYSGKLHTDDHYDAAGIYYIKFDEIEAYEDLMRERVLGDIRAHPFWYAGILVRRALRALTTTLPLPMAGWAVLPALWLASRRRRYDLLRLLVVSLPLSTTALLIYSGDGATYTSLFPYMALVTLLSLWWARRAAGLAAMGPV
jgi:hypothetical protein